MWKRIKRYFCNRYLGHTWEYYKEEPLGFPDGDGNRRRCTRCKTVQAPLFAATPNFDGYVDYDEWLTPDALKDFREKCEAAAKKHLKNLKPEVYECPKCGRKEQVG